MASFEPPYSTYFVLRLENKSCIDKLLRFFEIHDIPTIREPDPQHTQKLPIYAIPTEALEDALAVRQASSPCVNPVGRPRTDVTAEEIAIAYYANDLSISQIMQVYHISRSTVHRRLNEAAALGLHPRKYRKTDPNHPADNP